MPDKFISTISWQVQVVTIDETVKLVGSHI